MDFYRVEYVKFIKHADITKCVERISKDELIKLLKNEMVTVKTAKKLRE